MEQRLCKAAITGSVDELKEIISEDELILDQVVVGCLSRSPLHTAASYGRTTFVTELLRLNPKLARVVDSADRTALHLAAAEGSSSHVEVAKALIEAAPETCISRDRDGRNPLHVAAMFGQVEMLEVLVRANCHAARARLDRDETILHLCVKHKQLPALKKLLELIDDKDFLDARDSAGNTVLHLAVTGKQTEIVKYMTDEKKIKESTINAANSRGQTAIDILPKVIEDSEIESLLQRANAKGSKSLEQGQWVNKNKDALMVVASLIATVAFQVGVSPPGGVWQDSSNGHRAGEAVMAYHYPDSYPWFLRFSTIGFLASLSTILLLNSGLHMKRRRYTWLLMVVMWLAITFTAATYAVAITWITPKKDRKSLIRTIVVGIIVFCSIMSVLFTVHILRLIKSMICEKWTIKKAIKKIKIIRPLKATIWALTLARTVNSRRIGGQSNSINGRNNANV